MAQCALTQYTVCWTAGGSVFISVSDFYQNIVGGLTLDTFGPSNGVVSSTPIAGTLTPGQSYTMFAGTINVQTDGVQINFGNSLPVQNGLNNHNVQVCATDNNGQTCCTLNLTFDGSANCAVTGNCLNQTLSPGTLSPSDFVAGATSFSTTQNVVAGQSGITVNSVTPTSINISCDGTSNGSITVRMADNSECTALINCGGVVSGCLGTPINIAVGTPLAITPAMVAQGATAFSSPAVAGEADPSGCITVLNDQTDLVRVSCSGACTDAVLSLNVVGVANPCPVSIICGGTTGSTLACSGTTQTVAAGSTISAVNLATGGTQPYTISSLQNNEAGITNTSSAILIGSTVGPGFNTFLYTITDGNGDSVTCQMNLTVTSTCTNNAVITISPTNPEPGDAIVITVNGCDCPGYSHELKNGWYDNPNNTTTGFNTNPVTIPIPNPTGDTINTQIPTTAPANQTYGFHVECCNS